MLGAKPSGTEESVENSLSAARPCGGLTRAQVDSGRSAMPAPGLGTVRGGLTENVYRSRR
ncbi:hypothetical protein A5652_01860 [Mycobacterium sp. 1165178.9]|nr:hypothetical protein A5652_01860 [Mycobacterium sp. 1165178.9]